MSCVEAGSSRSMAAEHHLVCGDGPCHLAIPASALPALLPLAADAQTSMMSGEMWEVVEGLLKAVRERDQPAGGLQLIFCG